MTFRLNAALLLLITAFLTMQWTTSHFHLAEQHDHNGQHQHQAEIHTHDLNNLYVADVDSSHQISHSNAIELECEYCSSKRGELAKTTIVNAPFYLSPRVSQLGNKIKYRVNTKLRYFYHAIKQPRAPPYT